MKSRRWPRNRPRCRADVRPWSMAAIAQWSWNTSGHARSVPRPPSAAAETADFVAPAAFALQRMGLATARMLARHDFATRSPEGNLLLRLLREFGREHIAGYL